MTDKYPDDCKSRDGKSPLMCKIFNMSCAFFHTCIFGHKDGKCCYYEAKP